MTSLGTRIVVSVVVACCWTAVAEAGAITNAVTRAATSAATSTIPPAQPKPGEPTPNVPADTRKPKFFGRFVCAGDCSGHKAGFAWARTKNITDARQCSASNNSPSFREGCLVFAENEPKVEQTREDAASAAKRAKMKRIVDFAKNLGVSEDELTEWFKEEP